MGAEEKVRHTNGRKNTRFMHASETSKTRKEIACRKCLNLASLDIRHEKQINYDQNPRIDGISHRLTQNCCCQQIILRNRILSRDKPVQKTTAFCAPFVLIVMLCFVLLKSTN